MDNQLDQISLFTVAGICTLLGFLLTKGIDALIKWRQDSRIDVQYEDEKTAKGYNIVIANLRERLTNVENGLAKTTQDHIECLKLQEGFRVKVTMQQATIDGLKVDYNNLRIDYEALRDHLGKLGVLGTIKAPPSKEITDDPGQPIY